MVKPSSDKLLAFYRWWWNNSDSTMTHERGLCFCLDRWSGEDRFVKAEMIQQFKDAGLDPWYPFDESDNAHGMDLMRGQMRKNRDRYNWVRTRINEGTQKQLGMVEPESLGETDVVGCAGQGESHWLARLLRDTFRR